MLRIVILEDQVETRELLKKLIMELDDDTTIFESGSSKLVLEYASSNSVDMFFLDIQVDDYSGMVLASEIRELPSHAFTPIVFITAIPTKEMEAYKNIHCYDYIIKPFANSEIKEIIARMISSRKAIDDSKVLKIENKGYFTRIKKSDILYIEYRMRGVFIVTAHDVIPWYGQKISSAAEVLGDDFVQVHKAYVVNVNHIKSIDTRSNTVVMDNCDKVISIGRTYKSKVGSIR